MRHAVILAALLAALAAPGCRNDPPDRRDLTGVYRVEWVAPLKNGTVKVRTENTAYPGSTQFFVVPTPDPVPQEGELWAVVRRDDGHYAFAGRVRANVRDRGFTQGVLK
jgi:hypothetical protein